MLKIKLHKKTYYFLVVFGLLFASFLMVNTFSSMDNSADTTMDSYVLDCLKDSQYKKEDYIIINGSFIAINENYHCRILIDDTVPGYNWSSWAANYTWITGLGTKSDPYIIDGLYMDCENYGGGIFIEWSQKYFIIRNCWFENMRSTEVTGPVQLHHTRNGVVRDNVMINFEIGVAIRHACYNILVYNNIMISDSRAASHPVSMSQCHNCTIKENKALNTYNGIWLSDSDTLIIDGNYMENNIREVLEGTTIMAFFWINNCSIVRNIVAGSFALGKIKFFELDSSGNVIFSNYISFDQGLSYDFSNITLSSIEPQLSQDEEEATTFKLEDCHNNYIAYNVALLEGSAGDEGIPGYEPFLILGVTCAVSFILLRRKLKH